MRKQKINEQNYIFVEIVEKKIWLKYLNENIDLVFNVHIVINIQNLIQKLHLIDDLTGFEINKPLTSSYPFYLQANGQVGFNFIYMSKWKTVDNPPEDQTNVLIV